MVAAFFMACVCPSPDAREAFVLYVFSSGASTSPKGEVSFVTSSFCACVEAGSDTSPLGERLCYWSREKQVLFFSMVLRVVSMTRMVAVRATL